MTRVSALLMGAALLAAPALGTGGSEQFRQGQATFAETCAMCHGENGRGGAGYANPIWGEGAQIAKFVTAERMFEYHRDLMPFDDPTRVSDEAKWAVTLFILANHGAVPADATLGPQNAASVAIPRR